ncbi:MAG: glycosyltransferase family 2 protein [Pseudomonadota bacterium]
MTWRAVTAIVVSYHTGRRLRDCLYALKSDPEVDGIVVINNGNPAPDTEWLDQTVAQWDTVEAVMKRENIGFGPACNLGASLARGDFLVFVNPDAMVRRGSVFALQSACKGQPSPCQVGGKIFGADGIEQRGARRRELTWASALGLRRWTLEHTPAPSAPTAMDVVSGAFFAMPKSDFNAIGGFDETYFLHVEDIDLSRTVRAQGGSVLYQPLAAALHDGATSDADSRTVARHKADSLTYYFRKWARTPSDRALNFLLLPLLRWRIIHRAR